MPAKSTTAGILVIFAGYTIASYGVVLLRDYNITWKQWINPLNPWIWKGTPPGIPPGQLWPGGGHLPDTGLANKGTVQGVISAANNPGLTSNG